MIKKRIKNDKTRQGIEANVASLLLDLLLDCKKNDQIFSNKIQIYEKHKVPSCFSQIFNFRMFTIEMIDVLVVATSFLEITCVGQLEKSMRQLGIYAVAVAAKIALDQPSPARKFDALPLPLQSRILEPPACSPARWYAAATLCLMWNVGAKEQKSSAKGDHEKNGTNCSFKNGKMLRSIKLW